jgi:glyoxylase-like metal-dependent hydrolase (beta-lactamase superfamily II)
MTRVSGENNVSSHKVISILLALSLMCSSAWAQDARSVIADASRAMGIEGLNSITYYGAGTSFALGQAASVNGLPAARSNLSDYRRTLDFVQPAATTSAVTYAAPAAGGPARFGVFNEVANASNANSWSQQMQIWLSPWGFLKGAAANAATVEQQTANNRTVQVVSWESPIKSPAGVAYKLVGYINEQNLVERVETWLENPIFGDMLVQANYTQYRRNHEGLMFPAMVIESRGGSAMYPIQIFAAEGNPALLAQYLQPLAAPNGVQLAAPPAAATTPPAAPQVQSQQLADGVYRITGGYVAVAVEFSDHILIFEAAGQNENRAQAVMAEAKRVIPGKPIRYAVLSHHHFDHTSGLPAVVAEGATIVTHEINKEFFERALGAPRTLRPDAMALSGKQAVIEGVGAKRVFADALHTLELHHIQGLPHAEDMLVMYLPKEKIVVFADMYNVPPATDPVPNPPVIGTVVMMDNLARLGLDFDTLVSVHAPNPDVPITKASVLASLGRSE